MPIAAIAVQNYKPFETGRLWKAICTVWYLYGSNHTSTMYVGKDKDKAVVFRYSSRYAEKTLPVRFVGLDDKMYRVKRNQLWMPGANSFTFYQAMVRFS